MLDWFRAAAVALGETFAALEPRLTFVVAHIPIILIDALQIGIELIVLVIFQLAYGVPPTNTNPLENIDAAIIGIGNYCLSNSSTAHTALLNLYNGSAAIGLLFGCPLPFRIPVSFAFPQVTPRARTSRSSPRAPSARSRSPGVWRSASTASVASSSSSSSDSPLVKVLVETVDILEKLLCLFGQLVQFDPTLRTFADISLDRVLRSALHFWRCLARLLFASLLFVHPSTSIYFPGQPHTWNQGGSTGPVPSGSVGKSCVSMRGRPTPYASLSAASKTSSGHSSLV